MKLSLSFLSQSIKLWFFVLMIAFATIVPGRAFCQEEQDQQEEITVPTSPNAAERPIVGSSTPWENSANTPSAGNDDNTDNTSATQNPSSTRPTIGQRPGDVVDGRDPPGNPDVPFDPKMNVLFLITGIGFAFWIARKKLQPRN